jgi:hypothetical protein
VPTLGRDGKVFELLAEDDDRLAVEERVLHRMDAPAWGAGPVLRSSRRSGGAVEVGARLVEEGEDVFEARSVELGQPSEERQNEPPNLRTST